jgi:hypothetical protein
MKPFKHKNEEIAMLTLWNNDPIKRIDLVSPWDCLKPNEARRLAKWLLKAADYAEKEKKK